MAADAGAEQGTVGDSLPARPPREGPTAAAVRQVLFICQGPSCGERGGERLLQELRERQSGAPWRSSLQICATSCLDSCPTGPNVLLAGEAGLLTGQLEADVLLEGLPLAAPASE